MFLHRRFIFTDEAYVLGLKFTGAVQSLLNSDDHLKIPYVKIYVGRVDVGRVRHHRQNLSYYYVYVLFLSSVQ